MIASQTGSNIHLDYFEPTTNADGTPLSDLATTEVVADWGQGPQVVATTPASSPTGGGPIGIDFTVPVVAGTQMTVTMTGFASDLVGNKSVASVPAVLSIDLLAPAPPI